MIDQNELKDILRKAVIAAGSQSKWARRYGIKSQYVSAVLSGVTSPGPQIYEALGYKKVIAFIACNDDKTGA